MRWQSLEVTGQIDIRLTHSIRARTRLFISDVSKPSRQTTDYMLDESVGYLLGRVRSTMWNMVTQQTMADLGITATHAGILFILETRASPGAEHHTLASGPSCATRKKAPRYTPQ